MSELEWEKLDEFDQWIADSDGRVWETWQMLNAKYSDGHEVGVKLLFEARSIGEAKAFAQKIEDMLAQ